MKETKMSFVEISRLYNAVHNTSQVKFHAKPKFRYALAKNRDILEPFMKQLQEASKVPEGDKDIDAYEVARKELVKKYAGNKRMVPQEKTEDFMNDLRLFQEGDFKDGWDKITKFQESVNKFREEKQSVQLFMVEVDLIPEDLDDQMAVNDLLPILVDNSKQK